jgi:acetyl esterase
MKRRKPKNASCLIVADDLSGLPLAIIITAEFDPLCDGGEQYTQKLADAGVSVKSQRFDGVNA